MTPFVAAPVLRGHVVPSAAVLCAGGRGVPTGTNGYTTSWGPTLSGCPADG